MVRWLSVFPIICLAGCATPTGNDAKLYPGLFGQKVVGNEAYVTVSNVWNEMDALPLADAHCKKYGRIARFRGIDQYRAVYDCVTT